MVELTLSPCLFLAALADPRIFKGLITDGTGRDASGVTPLAEVELNALAGDRRSRRRRTLGPMCCGTRPSRGVACPTRRQASSMRLM